MGFTAGTRIAQYQYKQCRVAGKTADPSINLPGDPMTALCPHSPLIYLPTYQGYLTHCRSNHLDDGYFFCRHPGRNEVQTRDPRSGNTPARTSTVVRPSRFPPLKGMTRKLDGPLGLTWMEYLQSKYLFRAE